MNDYELVDAMGRCDDYVTCRGCRYVSMCDGPVALMQLAAKRMAELLERGGDADDNSGSA